jgi:hypothetical protein
MTHIAEQTASIVKARDIIGVGVVSKSHENLGKIEEIVLDKISGQACYVVLSFGGFLGMGDKLIAMPWNAIRFSPEDNCFILNASKARLENAPSFSRNKWPDMADQTWGEKIYQHYGTLPHWRDDVASAQSQRPTSITNSWDETSSKYTAWHADDYLK